MNTELWLRRAIGAAALALASLAAGAVLAQQQAPKTYPYPVVRDQRGVIPPGPTRGAVQQPRRSATARSTSKPTNSGTSASSVVTKGLSHPWSLAFLPGGDILVTERIGRLRLVRNGVLQPEPVAGTPKVVSLGTMAGLMDIALHPRFAENKWIYISYHKPVGDWRRLGRQRVAAGQQRDHARTWDGNSSPNVKDIFVADDVDMEASRIAFGLDGMLYMTIGGPGTGPHESLDRPQHGNDYAGKILRMRDDGSVPPDNPFVGKAGYKPYIYSMGHRNQLGLAINPFNGEIWAGEQGPNGGDEVNIIKAGKNYGWPIVSDGRDYRGPYISRVAVQGRHGAATRRVGAVDRSVGHGVLHRRPLSRTGSATCSSAACARARSRARANCSASCSTTTGRRCAASRCCAICISVFATCARAPTDCCTCLTEEDAAALLRIEPADQ